MFLKTSDLRNMFWQQNLDNKILIFLSCIPAYVHAVTLESEKDNDLFANLQDFSRQALAISLTWILFKGRIVFENLVAR